VIGQLFAQVAVGQEAGWDPEPVRNFCRSDKCVTPGGISTPNRLARSLPTVRTTLLGTERGRLEGGGREGASAVNVGNLRSQCRSWSQDC
jgi:hypothetical protein